MLSTTAFTFIAASRSFVADASDITLPVAAMSEGITLKSAKTGVEKLFTPAGYEIGEDGLISVRFTHGDMEIVVFND